MASTALPMPGPSAATKHRARTSRGKARKDVGDAAQHRVDPAAEIGGRDPDRETGRHHHGRDQHDDHQGRARALEQPRIDVATEFVGAKPMRRTGRRETRREVLVERRVTEGKDGRAGGRERQEGDNEKPRDRKLVAQERARGPIPTAAKGLSPGTGSGVRQPSMPASPRRCHRLRVRGSTSRAMPSAPTLSRT